MKWERGSGERHQTQQTLTPGIVLLPQMHMNERKKVLCLWLKVLVRERVSQLLPRLASWLRCTLKGNISSCFTW